MRKMIPAMLAYIMIISGGLSFAHGDDQRIMGTVTALSPGQVQVRTVDGANLTLTLIPDTKIRSAEASASGLTLQVGDRLVADFVKERDQLTAHEIRFSRVGEGKTR